MAYDLTPSPCVCFFYCIRHIPLQSLNVPLRLRCIMDFTAPRHGKFFLLPSSCSDLHSQFMEFHFHRHVMVLQTIFMVIVSRHDSICVENQPGNVLALG